LTRTAHNFSDISGLQPNPVKNVRGLHIQALGNFAQPNNGNITAATFDMADIGAMQIGFKGQFLLGKTFFLPQFLDSGAKFFSNTHGKIRQYP